MSISPALNLANAIETGMVTLTEQQRQDAIRSCERIEQIYAQQQVALQNIIRIFDNAANGRDPNDGVVKFEDQGA